MKKRWTKQEEQYVADNYRKGEGLQHCANYLQREIYAVKQKARRLGVAGIRRSFTDEEIRFIKENHQYLGYVKIAEILGVKKSSINNLCSKRGLGLKMIPSFRAKISAEKNKTWERTAEMRANMSAAAKKLGRVGENHPSWKGGVSTLRSIVSRKLWPVWVIPILSRDGYACTKCGSGENLNVHHKKRYTEIRDEVVAEYGNIDNQTLSDLIVSRHTFDMGVTLCYECHRKIHFGKRGELLGTPTATGEDNQQPSRSNVVSMVGRKVQRLTGEETQTNKPDTSAPLTADTAVMMR